jgi:hypothetical protein
MGGGAASGTVRFLYSSAKTFRIITGTMLGRHRWSLLVVGEHLQSICVQDAGTVLRRTLPTVVPPYSLSWTSSSAYHWARRVHRTLI